MKFDVHRSNYPGSDLGPFLSTLEASTHRQAQELAAEKYRAIAVVVVPHRKPNEKLERALRGLERGLRARRSKPDVRGGR